MKEKITVITLVLLEMTAGFANAKEGGASAFVAERFSSAEIVFSEKRALSKGVLTISGPAGFYAKKYQHLGVPTINLADYGDVVDGLYQYELSANGGDVIEIKDTLNNGRGENYSHYAQRGITKSGHFRVVDGKIKRFTERNERQPLSDVKGELE